MTTEAITQDASYANAEKAQHELMNGLDRNWYEISEDHATWMLECVPPIRQSGWNFMNCEEYTHTQGGEGVYFTSRYHDGKHYMTYATVKEWDDRLLFGLKPLPPIATWSYS